MLSTVSPDYFRNAVFGIEDSLVSTVGVLFGVSTSVTDRSVILLTAIVLIAVEALSMGVGSYLSEKSEHSHLAEMTRRPKKDQHTDNPAIDGIIMGVSYFLAGFIPTSPYLVLPVNWARLVSVIVSISALFLLGYLANRQLRSTLEMGLLGGGAIVVGSLAGHLVTLN